MRAWVIGRGGLLGGAVARALAPGEIHEAAPVDWSDPAASIRDLTAEWERFTAGHEPGRSWCVLWCAGVGVVGTRPEALDGEAEVLGALTALVADRPLAGPGAFVLSSSAGVYAGSSRPPFDEATDPVPRNAYGHTKLRQEAIAAEALTGRVSLAVARISTLYGPGQDLAKPQGLISQVCLRAVHRQPVVLYVPLDTLRDYLFADDAGRRLVRLARDTVSGRPASPVLRVVANESPVAISEIIALVRAASRTAVGVVQIPAATSGQHVRDLRVRTRHPDEWDRDRTSLRRGIRIVYDDIASDPAAATSSPA